MPIVLKVTRRETPFEIEARHLGMGQSSPDCLRKAIHLFVVKKLELDTLLQSKLFV